MTALKIVKAELLSLVREDKIYPMCLGCEHILSFGEYLNLFCQRCGDVSIWENDKILFYPSEMVE